MENFRLTKHAIDRLIERAPKVLDIWPYLKSWDRNKNPHNFRGAFYEILEKSSENKSLINDTGYMASHYWDKYGFDSEFKFFENQDFKIKFVFVKNRGELDFNLATVTPFHGVQKTNKWAKIQTKEEKEQTFVLRAYEQDKTFIEMGATVFEQSRSTKPSVPVETEIKLQLFKLVKEGKTNCIEKVSNALAIHKASLNNFDYEFRHYKFKDAKALEVISIGQEKNKPKFK
jgi:hypothetical protein